MTIAADPEGVVRDAFALAPLFREQAREAERLRTLPRALVDACASAGLFSLSLPRSLGGLECDPLTTIRVIEELARADASGGWTVMIGNTTAFTAWLEPDVARDILGPLPRAPMAGLLMPAGTAVPDGRGGLIVSGRWPFNSGAPHAAWFCSGIMVMDGDRPRMVPPGRPDWRFAFFPASDATIIDTWHAAGLKGTGSHDIVVQGLRVPEERTAAPFFEPARQEGPLSRFAVWTHLMILMAGVPLGIGRRALDEFRELSPHKSRALDGAALRDDPVVQVDFATAEADVQAARALVLEAFGQGWVAVQTRENTLDERARMTMALVQAARLCTRAVDVVFHRAGGGALYDSSPLQRCFRDMHAAAQHIALGIETWKRVGKALLGVEQPTSMV